MEKSHSASYAAAGVDIEAGYEGVKLMRKHVERTMIPGVVSDIGGFGGLFAPGQGLFPRYDGGLYRRGQARMVVSRGLGNSLDAQLDVENELQTIAGGTHDYREGVQAFLEKRKPVYKGE